MSIIQKSLSLFLRIIVKASIVIILGLLLVGVPMYFAMSTDIEWYMGLSDSARKGIFIPLIFLTWFISNAVYGALNLKNKINQFSGIKI
jgi:hypothetical protein